MAIKVALVLPAYNEGKNIKKSLGRIKKGIDAAVRKNSNLRFVLHIIDDGSADNTLDEIKKWTGEYKLDYVLHRFSKNRGVAQVLRRVYPRVLDTKPNYIIKTDLDSDFDGAEVIRKFVGFILKGAKGVAGVLWRRFSKRDNLYEFNRREELLRLLDREFKLKELDPPSVGSQLYRADILRGIMKNPLVRNYNLRWGLDFLIPLLAVRKHRISIVRLRNVGYDPSRRGYEKVKAQYDSFVEIVGKIVGKKAERLSGMYGK